jgi:hypothetical protein
MDALNNIKMSERERVEISSFIESEFGIKMPAVKNSSYQQALQKAEPAGMQKLCRILQFYKVSKGRRRISYFC